MKKTAAQALRRFARFSGRAGVSRALLAGVLGAAVVAQAVPAPASVRNEFRIEFPYVNTGNDEPANPEKQHDVSASLGYTFFFTPLGKAGTRPIELWRYYAVSSYIGVEAGYQHAIQDMRDGDDRDWGVTALTLRGGGYLPSNTGLHGSYTTVSGSGDREWSGGRLELAVDQYLFEDHRASFTFRSSALSEDAGLMQDEDQREFVVDWTSVFSRMFQVRPYVSILQADYDGTAGDAGVSWSRDTNTFGLDAIVCPSRKFSLHVGASYASSDNSGGRSGDWTQTGLHLMPKVWFTEHFSWEIFRISYATRTTDIESPAKRDYQSDILGLRTAFTIRF